MSDRPDTGARERLSYTCAHDHRWTSEPPSTRCPVCGTITFKPLAAGVGVPPDAGPQPPLYEDGRGVFVYVCDLCGQFLGGPDDVCNSGFHVGPSGETKGKAVATVALVGAPPDAETRWLQAAAEALDVIRDYLDWQHAVHGGFATEELHRELYCELVAGNRRKPSLDEAREALAGLRDMTGNQLMQEEYNLLVVAVGHYSEEYAKSGEPEQLNEILDKLNPGLRDTTAGDET